MIIGIPPERGKRWDRLDPKVRDVPLGIRIGVLGKKWSLLILRQVAVEGRPGFNRLLDMQRGISRRQLSIRLKELQRGGYLEKLITHVYPKRTAYLLTDKGRDALPLLYAFSELVRRYGEGVPVARGRAVPAQDLCLSHPEIRREPGKDLFDSSTFDHATVSFQPRVATYKSECEKCGRHLTVESDAYVCRYQCTWCRACAERFDWRCPNCQGRLQPRLRRQATGSWPHQLLIADLN